jgi:hypothetical protein
MIMDMCVGDVRTVTVAASEFPDIAKGLEVPLSESIAFEVAVMSAVNLPTNDEELRKYCATRLVAIAELQKEEVTKKGVFAVKKTYDMVHANAIVKEYNIISDYNKLSGEEPCGLHDPDDPDDPEGTPRVDAHTCASSGAAVSGVSGGLQYAVLEREAPSVYYLMGRVGIPATLCGAEEEARDLKAELVRLSISHRIELIIIVAEQPIEAFTGHDSGPLCGYEKVMCTYVEAAEAGIRVDVLQVIGWQAGAAIEKRAWDALSNSKLRASHRVMVLTADAADAADAARPAAMYPPMEGGRNDRQGCLALLHIVTRCLEDTIAGPNYADSTATFDTLPSPPVTTGPPSMPGDGDSRETMCVSIASALCDLLAASGGGGSLLVTQAQYKFAYKAACACAISLTK